MKVRFHTAIFDHTNFHSSKVIGNQVHLYHVSDEDVVKFKTNKEAEEAHAELERIIFRAEQGTYVPEGIDTKAADKVLAMLDKAQNKLDGVLSNLKEKATEVAVEKTVDVVKGKTASLLSGLKGKAVELAETAAEKAIDTVASRMITIPTSGDDKSTKEVEDFLAALFGSLEQQTHDEEEAPKKTMGDYWNEQDLQITRDEPKRRRLLDDADVFGTDRSQKEKVSADAARPKTKNSSEPSLVLPEDEWDIELQNVPTDVLRATLNDVIQKSAATDRVREMFKSQNLSDDELNAMLEDYLNLLMDAAQMSGDETLRNMIESLLR